MEALYVRVDEVTQKIVDFNGFLYKMLSCSAENDDPFDTLVSVEVSGDVEVGDVLCIENCKIVHIDPDLYYTRIAIRADKVSKCEKTQPISKYYNIPFIGRIKTNERNKPKEFGPDRKKFYTVPIHLQETITTNENPDKKTFSIMLMSFGSKTKLLQEFPNHSIIRGTATLKHKPKTKKYSLALISAELYES